MPPPHHCAPRVTVRSTASGLLRCCGAELCPPCRLPHSLGLPRNTRRWCRRPWLLGWSLQSAKATLVGISPDCPHPLTEGSPFVPLGGAPSWWATISWRLPMCTPEICAGNRHRVGRWLEGHLGHLRGRALVARLAALLGQARCCPREFCASHRHRNAFPSPHRLRTHLNSLCLPQHGGPANTYSALGLSADSKTLLFHPLYYGLLAFSELTANHARWRPSVLSFHQHAEQPGQPEYNLVAHAAEGAAGEVRVLLLNKELKETAAANVTVTVTLWRPAPGADLPQARVARLLAGGPSSPLPRSDCSSCWRHLFKAVATTRGYA